MARKFKTTRIRIPYRRLPTKTIKGKVYIDFGADNFCYVYARNGKRVNLTEWMKKFNGKDIELQIRIMGGTKLNTK